jgi:NAD+ diphosphatase
MTDLPLDPFFSGAGLDRADALRADKAAVAALAARADARELKWADGLPELTPEGRLAWQPIAGAEIFLGLDGTIPCFSTVPETRPDAWSAFPLLAILDDREAPLFAAALSLARWHSHHRFCPSCGEAIEIVRAGWSRRCAACSVEHFPRVDPVVIMVAEFDGQLLLGRQPQYPPGRYSALAGFVEVGETIEAAVRRELQEEAGVQVRDVSYVASQPWPFPSSLMIGCTAKAQSSELTIDTAELEDARWFSREEIAEALEGGPNAAFQPPPRAAIARTLLERWLAA